MVPLLALCWAAAPSAPGGAQLREDTRSVEVAADGAIASSSAERKQYVTIKRGATYTKWTLDYQGCLSNTTINAGSKVLGRKESRSPVFDGYSCLNYCQTIGEFATGDRVAISGMQQCACLKGGASGWVQDEGDGPFGQPQITKQADWAQLSSGTDLCEACRGQTQDGCFNPEMVLPCDYSACGGYACSCSKCKKIPDWKDTDAAVPDYGEYCDANCGGPGAQKCGQLAHDGTIGLTPTPNAIAVYVATAHDDTPVPVTDSQERFEREKGDCHLSEHSCVDEEAEAAAAAEDAAAQTTTTTAAADGAAADGAADGGGVVNEDGVPGDDDDETDDAAAQEEADRDADR